MPFLPFLMYAIAVAGVFFLAGINYMKTDHLIDREHFERLAGEYIVLTMSLEAYRAENGAFPPPADWRGSIEVYTMSRHIPVRPGDDWTYAATADGYVLCFKVTPPRAEQSAGTGSEIAVVEAPSPIHTPYLCPRAPDAAA